MNIKHFIFNNKDIFSKTPKDVYNFHQDIIKICIEQYQCPDVFAEMEQMRQNGNSNPSIRNTKFYRYWINRQRDLKTLKNPSNEIIKTTKEIVKKRVLKDKIVKQQEGIVIERQPIEQTLEVKRVYHKINFSTDVANEYYKFLDLMLKKIRLKASDIFNVYKEYKAKLDETDNPVEVDKLNKKLICFERLNKMMSDSFNDGQAFQTQLRMLIENEKQILEHNLYEKEINQTDKIEITADVIHAINEKLTADNDFKEFVQANFKS